MKGKMGETVHRYSGQGIEENWKKSYTKRQQGREGRWQEMKGERQYRKALAISLWLH